jgi:hypothetical protein
MARKDVEHGKFLGRKSGLKPALPIGERAKERSKPDHTVSSARILKRKPIKEVYRNRRSRRHRRSSPENELFLEYKGIRDKSEIPVRDV